MRIRSLLLVASTCALSACGVPPEESEHVPSSTGDVQQDFAFACVYAIKTQNGHYLTAVDGGGHATNAMASNRTQVGSWEEFAIIPVDLNAGTVSINAINPLTADGGGGKTRDAIKTNRTAVGAWETFKLRNRGNSTYAIQTFDGHFVTAVGGGGKPTGPDVLHTDATAIGSWEQFRLETQFCL
jgi:hypothetical protein